MDVDLELREARPEDHEAVAAITEDTWPDREGEDYLARVYPEWIEGEERETFVLDAGTELAGIAQCVSLSEYEAWCQGMRMNPEYRGRGISKRLSEALFDWACEQGATVARNMVFSWNVAGLGQSRSVGFEPVTEFRWATPEPDPDAEADLRVREDPKLAWHAWVESDAAAHLRGLALDTDESWALSRLTPADLERASEEAAVFAVLDDGVGGMAHRVRVSQHGEDAERVAIYGTAVWESVEASRALVAAIARDAAEVGADSTRALLPETPRYVSDAAYARSGISDEPDFVLGADLTRR
ncbi:GNAT family N-acetyltransferase [Natronorarus salvus]|uniref:GNAT family N-acetyltransferase n=1 Tax=Natronorarus salvus TaxID=3117733 RepID=UPI002F26142F